MNKEFEGDPHQFTIQEVKSKLETVKFNGITANSIAASVPIKSTPLFDNCMTHF